MSTSASWRLAATSGRVSGDVGCSARYCRRAVLEARAREADRGRVPVARQAVDHRTARIAEAEKLGRLVEGLANRVVAGAAEAGIASALPRQIEPGVPARDYQREERERHRVAGWAVEIRGEEMALQVVHAD